MLDLLDQGVVGVVLVPTKAWLAPLEEAQRRMAEMISDHGGTLVIVEAAEALGIAPPATFGNGHNDSGKRPA
jgi:hypothetical protein